MAPRDARVEKGDADPGSIGRVAPREEALPGRHVDNGVVAHWQVTVKIGFSLED